MTLIAPLFVPAAVILAAVLAFWRHAPTKAYRRQYGIEWCPYGNTLLEDMYRLRAGSVTAQALAQTKALQAQRLHTFNPLHKLKKSLALVEALMNCNKALQLVKLQCTVTPAEWLKIAHNMEPVRRAQFEVQSGRGLLKGALSGFTVKARLAMTFLGTFDNEDMYLDGDTVYLVKRPPMNFLKPVEIKVQL